uniref:Uncharacterized protein n=1 Tax=Tetraselmis sp. GSL018 TaxID=582737 RepID=A0A061SFV8_9CHLO
MGKILQYFPVKTSTRDKLAGNEVEDRGKESLFCTPSSRSCQNDRQDLQGLNSGLPQLDWSTAGPRYFALSATSPANSAQAPSTANVLDVPVSATQVHFAVPSDCPVCYILLICVSDSPNQHQEEIFVKSAFEGISSLRKQESTRDCGSALSRKLQILRFCQVMRVHVLPCTVCRDIISMGFDCDKGPICVAVCS